MSGTSAKTGDSLLSRLSNTLKAKSKLLIVVGSVICVALVGTAVFFTVTENQKAVAISEVETYAQRYDELRMDLDSHASEIDTLLGELNSFVKHSRDYSTSRAWSLIGSIQSDRKNWIEAEKAYVAAMEAQPKSYQAPIALFQAATTAEERGDTERALALYRRCAENYDTTFPEAPRAYFAIGRICEDRKDYESAISAYQKIISMWPNDNWTRLANGRIILISSRKGN